MDKSLSAALAELSTSTITNVYKNLNPKPLAITTVKLNNSNYL